MFLTDFEWAPHLAKNHILKSLEFFQFLGYFCLHCFPKGGIKIENRKNLGNCPNRGVKKTEMSQFQSGNFENREGGSLFFKNVPISII